MVSLSQRIKAAQAASAPSLVPDGAKPERKYESEVLPEIEDVLDTKLANKVRKLIAGSIALASDIKALQSARDEITAQIKSSLDLEGSPMKFQCSEGRLNFFPTFRSTLDKKLLLGAGVSPQVIVACTVTKESYTLRITGATEEE